MTDLVVAAANPVRLILFGSRARAGFGADSDFDLLVVQRETPDRVGEMVRLSRVLRPLGEPVDVLVVAAETFEYWKDTPGNIYYDAATEGRTLYEAA